MNKKGSPGRSRRAFRSFATGLFVFLGWAFLSAGVVLFATVVALIAAAVL